MRRLLLPALLLPDLLLGACAGGKPDADDTDDETDLVDTDVAPVHTDETDVADTSPWDDGTGWSVDTDDTDVFPPPETGDTGACAPIALSEVMAVCGGTQTLVSHIADPLHASCPDYWTAGGSTGATVEDALDAAGCERSCVYRQRVAVMVLYCGGRGEYVVWDAGAPGQVGPGDGCPSWTEANTVLGSGWFPSWHDYRVAFPCPNPVDSGTDTGDTGVDSDTDLPVP